MKCGANPLLRRFAANRDGNVAMMFGFAFVGIVLASGMAIDMSRQAEATANAQSAVDSIALSLAVDSITLTPAQLQAKAQAKFDAMTAGGPLAGLHVTATYTTTPTTSLTVTFNDSIPSMFGALIGRDALPLNVTTNVPINMKPAEIVLVLDNTGSMNGSNKLAELKTAAKNLVSIIKGTSGDVKVGLVPFSTQVKIGTASANASWLDWSGFNSNKSNWDGCVKDRDQPYDTKSTIPTTDSDTWYPTGNCNLALMMPLTNDWDALTARIDEMKASGNTNITIGLAWGLNMMTSGAPLSAASTTPEKYQRYMVLLTDGDNTQNRWTNDSVSIDSRTLEACAQVKNAGITLYTIRVIDGNSNLLRSCASATANFFEVANATQLTGVFNQIGSQIASAIRLAR